MSLSAKSVLLQILSEANEKNLLLGKTQIVKFLYLTEVEYYRETGNRLTDLNWLFYHYGPYALELDSILNEKEFEMEKKETKSDREFHIYKIAESPAKYSSKVDPKVGLIIKRIVSTWGNKPLEELLDYVYFETEPMEAVKRRGERLDFSTVKKEPITRVIPLKASKETERKVAQLRERLAPALKKMGEERIRQRRTEAAGKEYAEAMQAWDEEMNAELDPEALKKIRIIITNPGDDSGKEGN